MWPPFLYIQLQMLWFLFSEMWCIHSPYWLSGKSSLSTYLEAYLIIKIGNIAVNISCTVLIEKNTCFTAPLVSLVDSARTGQILLHGVSISCCQNSIFCSSWASQQGRPHSNSSCSIPQNGPQVQQLSYFYLCGNKLYYCEFFFSTQSEDAAEMEDIMEVGLFLYCRTAMIAGGVYFAQVLVSSSSC